MTATKTIPSKNQPWLRDGFSARFDELELPRLIDGFESLSSGVGVAVGVAVAVAVAVWVVGTLPFAEDIIRVVSGTLKNL